MKLLSRLQRYWDNKAYQQQTREENKFHQAALIIEPTLNTGMIKAKVLAYLLVHHHWGRNYGYDIYQLASHTRVSSVGQEVQELLDAGYVKKATPPKWYTKQDLPDRYEANVDHSDLIRIRPLLPR